MSEINEEEIKRRFEVISQFESSPDVAVRDLQRARERLTEHMSGQQTREQQIWRTIMKSQITKLAAAAVIIIAVLIGINQFSNSTTSIAWGEVAKKVEASQGVIFRQRATSTKYPGGGSGYSIIYICPTHRRSDGYNKEGEIWISMYSDIEAGTGVVVLHHQKGYVHETLSERDVQNQPRWADPKVWVQKFLCCEYTKLGQKTVDGVLCEGLETTDPNLITPSPNFPIRNFAARLWVGVQTRYPVLLEGEFAGKYSGESVMDQFQWDVELDASLFEPNIPPDYEEM